MGEETARWSGCAFLGAQTACLCVIVFDFLVIAHSTVYIITRLTELQEVYAREHPQIEKILPYQYFVSLLSFLAIWALSTLIALVAIKCVVPYLSLPYLFVSTAVVAVAVALAIYSGICVAQYLEKGDDISVELALLLGVAIIFCLIETYSLSVKYITFKSLVKRKKAVQGTSEKPAIAEVIDPLESYSRRSTVIITDDFYEPPPLE